MVQVMAQTRRFVAFALACILGGMSGELLAQELQLLPRSVELSNPNSTQRLLLQQMKDSEATAQVHDEIEWTSSDETVATVSAGVVSPVGNGAATITAVSKVGKASVPVRVSGMEADFAWSFRNHVQPEFAKLGCNSGACHGAVAGKGGFRLSLRGYDPDADYFNIVKQDRGRRVEFSAPARSLVLTKPSGAIAHKGGLRFDTDSRTYKIISQWIAAGATAPQETDAHVVSLVVNPGRSLHRIGETQQLVVQAKYSDGSLEDVTRNVIWSSTNDVVCRVDEDGLATVVGSGEGAIVAWYASNLAIARITSPFNQDKPSAATTETTQDPRPPRNFIDEQIDKQLARLNLPKSPPCSDNAFIRRAYIDTIGRMPTPEETRKFLANKEPDARDQLIEHLLSQDEFVDYWTYRWSDVLMLNGTLLRPNALKAYYQSIRKHVEDDTPWDEFVNEVVTSTGSSVENGLTNFYALHQTPEDMTENACQAFLGLSIGCAKCHNHPLEKWTNDQYYGAANMFARVKAKGWGGETRNGDGIRTLYAAADGELVQPRTGKPQPPTPLDGTAIPFDDASDRRIHFANWLTSKENPYFARSITNRVWANFFSVGLVESVDDLRASNPASNEELLTVAANFVVDNDFQLKPLMKAILQSNAYQRSSQPLPENKDEKRFYSRCYPRRMMAEVLHDAIVQVTDSPSKFEFVAFPGADKQKTDFYPLGTRAVQLYDSAVENYFLQTFGRNSRRIVCECERSDEPTMVQVLHISNGNTINEKLSAKENRVTELIKKRAGGMTDSDLLDEIYLLCLARLPDDEEKSQLIKLLPAQGHAEERVVVEDIFWGLMSSREFLFNH